jgi:hypothetical protein
MMKIAIPIGIIFGVGILLVSSTVLAGPTVVQQVNGALCGPLPAPDGNIIRVSTVNQLWAGVNDANPGDTILIADGTYNLDGIYLRMDVPNVSVRSESGDRDAVILDGNYITTEIFQIVASNITIADLTLKEAYFHPIHVSTSGDSHTLDTLIHNVHIIDPGEQAIKINPTGSGYYADEGTIACSHIELTDQGRPHIRNNCYTGGIDAHQSRGWEIRDNQIEGFWCEVGLSEHGIHLWRGCRDTLIERNVLNDNARGIGLGLVTDGTGRTYPDDPCPYAVGYVDDFGGLVQNNFVSVNDPDLFASDFGFDCGICLWNACNGQVLHNTIYTADPNNTFSSIEWRFPNTVAVISNNLSNDEMQERDGAAGDLSGNLTTAQTAWFVDVPSGDLHLRSIAVEVINQATSSAGVLDDIDGDARPIGLAPDIGADEYGVPAPSTVTDLRITQVLTGTGFITVTMLWSPPLGAELQTIRYAADRITPANWDHAIVLSDILSGSISSYIAVVPYTNSTLYFVQKSYSSDGGWSGLSNNEFWPHLKVSLPILIH